MPNYSLISFISNVFQIINILIIIRVALSWFNYNAHNQYVRLLYKITEPILAPIRNLLSSFNMGIDISPLIAIFALSFIRNLLIRLLVQIQFNLIKNQPNSNPPRTIQRGVVTYKNMHTHCNFKSPDLTHIYFWKNFNIKQ